MSIRPNAAPSTQASQVTFLRGPIHKITAPTWPTEHAQSKVACPHPLGPSESHTSHLRKITSLPAMGLCNLDTEYNFVALAKMIPLQPSKHKVLTFGETEVSLGAPGTWGHPGAGRLLGAEGNLLPASGGLPVPPQGGLAWTCRCF